MLNGTLPIAERADLGGLLPPVSWEPGCLSLGHAPGHRAPALPRTGTRWLCHASRSTTARRCARAAGIVLVLVGWGNVPHPTELAWLVHLLRQSRAGIEGISFVTRALGWEHFPWQRFASFHTCVGTLLIAGTLALIAHAKAGRQRR